PRAASYPSAPPVEPPPRAARSSASSALRALPSFPTRRSSDLVAALGGDVSLPTMSEPGHVMVIDRFRVDVLTRVAIPGGELVGQDRKSTRLNSSHVKISYAVIG